MMTTDRTLEQVKGTEMKIAAFVIEHNLQFQVTDHLSDLVGSSFPDLTIAKKCITNTRKQDILSTLS